MKEDGPNYVSGHKYFKFNIVLKTNENKNNIVDLSVGCIS
jgi:hypothetical protein